MGNESAAAILQPLADALGADGYELDVEDKGGNALHLAVRATENACEECLVPKFLFADMAAHRLQEASGQEWEIEVTYPPGHPES
jgi:hypothetical protein